MITILNFLVETIPKERDLEHILVLLLKNAEKPILLNAASNIVTYFEKLRDYIGFLGKF